MALFRQGKKASFEAPVDGAIEAINPKVQQNPGLMHDDPYGEGWLFMVKPINLRRNLENLLSGEDVVIWIDRGVPPPAEPDGYPAGSHAA